MVGVLVTRHCPTRASRAVTCRRRLGIPVLENARNSARRPAAVSPLIIEVWNCPVVSIASLGVQHAAV
jgi:hypothetical protein